MVILGTITFDRVPSAVPQGRHYVRRLLAGEPVDLGSVEIAVSELMTNAVDHGGGDLVALTVELDPERIRVEVADAGATGRAPSLNPRAQPDEEHGRGLFLVAALAETWGVRRRPDGTTVWAELAKKPVG